MLVFVIVAVESTKYYSATIVEKARKREEAVVSTAGGKSMTTKRTTQKKPIRKSVCKKEIITVKKDDYPISEIELIKRTIAKGASDDELRMFIGRCKHTGLDPFARQIYAIKRKQYDSEAGMYVEKMSIEISIDGFRLIAERTKQYEGQDGPYWCGSDGQWVDAWIKKESPSAAKVGIYRKGFKQAIYSVARFDAYAARKKDGTLTAMWQKMPDVMLAKCAEAAALRRAFPQELSGLYSSDEMMQVDNIPMIENKQDKKEEPKKEIVIVEEKKVEPSIPDVFDDSKIPIDENKIKAIDLVESSQTVKQLTRLGETVIKDMHLSDENRHEVAKCYSRRMKELMKKEGVTK